MGVTTVREVATPQNLDVGLRDAINAGIVRGPRFFVSGSGSGRDQGMYGKKQAPFPDRSSNSRAPMKRAV